MNAHQKVAMQNIKGAFNSEVGAMYNSYIDGYEITVSLQDMKDIVYDCAINDDYRIPGMICFGKAPRQMRFAGKQFCLDYIDKLFAEDPDVEEIPWRED